MAVQYQGQGVQQEEPRRIPWGAVAGTTAFLLPAIDYVGTQWLFDRPAELIIAYPLMIAAGGVYSWLRRPSPEERRLAELQQGQDELRARLSEQERLYNAGLDDLRRRSNDLEKGVTELTQRYDQIKDILRRWAESETQTGR